MAPKRKKANRSPVPSVNTSQIPQDIVESERQPSDDEKVSKRIRTDDSSRYSPDWNEVNFDQDQVIEEVPQNLRISEKSKGKQPASGSSKNVPVEGAYSAPTADFFPTASEDPPTTPSNHGLSDFTSFPSSYNARSRLVGTPYGVPPFVNAQAHLSSPLALYGNPAQNRVLIDNRHRLLAPHGYSPPLRTSHPPPMPIKTESHTSYPDTGFHQDMPSAPTPGLGSPFAAGAPDIPIESVLQEQYLAIKNQLQHYEMMMRRAGLELSAQATPMTPIPHFQGVYPSPHLSPQNSTRASLHLHPNQGHLMHSPSFAGAMHRNHASSSSSESQQFPPLTNSSSAPVLASQPTPLTEHQPVISKGIHMSHAYSLPPVKQEEPPVMNILRPPSVNQNEHPEPVKLKITINASKTSKPIEDVSGSQDKAEAVSTGKGSESSGPDISGEAGNDSELRAMLAIKRRKPSVSVYTKFMTISPTKENNVSPAKVQWMSMSRFEGLKHLTNEQKSSIRKGDAMVASGPYCNLSRVDASLIGYTVPQNRIVWLEPDSQPVVGIMIGAVVNCQLVDPYVHNPNGSYGQPTQYQRRVSIVPTLWSYKNLRGFLRALFPMLSSVKLQLEQGSDIVFTSHREGARWKNSDRVKKAECAIFESNPDEENEQDDDQTPEPAEDWFFKNYRSFLEFDDEVPIYNAYSGFEFDDEAFSKVGDLDCLPDDLPTGSIAAVAFTANLFKYSVRSDKSPAKGSATQSSKASSSSNSKATESQDDGSIKAHETYCVALNAQFVLALAPPSSKKVFAD